MMKSKILISLIFVILIIFSYGIVVGHYHIFPFELMSDLKNSIFPQSESSPRKQIHQDFSEIDSLISFKNSSDILNKREMLIEYIWSKNSLPSFLPINYTTNITDELSNLKNLDRIDSFTVEMDYGMNSISYLFLANNFSALVGLLIVV